MYALYKLASLILAALPPTVVAALARAVGAVWFHVLRVRRGVAMENVQASLPELPAARQREIVKHCMQNLVLHYFTTLVWLSISREQIRARVRWVHEERVRDLYAKGKGVIAFSGHFGLWESLIIGAGVNGYKVNLAVRMPRSVAAKRMVEEVRAKGGFNGVPPKGSVAKLLAALERGEMSTVAVDQNQNRNGVFIPYFGRTCSATPAVALLAQRTGLPVQLMFALPEAGGTVRIYVTKSIPLDDLRDDPDFLLKATARFNAVLEAYVRLKPDVYLWMHRRWKTQPTDADKVAAQEHVEVTWDGDVRIIGTAAPRGRTATMN